MYGQARAALCGQVRETICGQAHETMCDRSRKRMRGLAVEQRRRRTDWTCPMLLWVVVPTSTSSFSRLRSLEDKLLNYWIVAQHRVDCAAVRGTGWTAPRTMRRGQM